MKNINKAAEALITQEYLKSIFTLNEAGDFVWLVRHSYNIPIGSVAGCINSTTGYRTITINDVRYRGHRLAWLYHYGVWPEQFINHKNGKKADNKIENLEDVSQSENLLNPNNKKRLPYHRTHQTPFFQKTNKANKSGVVGVSFDTSKSKWIAEFRSKKLGLFKMFEDAVMARKSAEQSFIGAI